MARLALQALDLSDGSTIGVRTAEEPDAAAWVDLIRALDGSDPPFATQADERDLDLERRARSVRARAEAPADLLLLALLGPRVVGYVDFQAHRLRRMAHVGWFHMGVHPEAQRRGIGSALLRALVQWARANPAIEKVCLGMFSTNAPGLVLYRKAGFAEEGRRVGEFKLGPGRYVDNVEMFLRVK